MKMTASRRMLLRAGLVFALVFATAVAGASMYSVTSTNNTFTITRDLATENETVTCRTVDLSAVQAVHFDAVTTNLTFGVGQTTKTVTVNEKSISSVPLAFRYQTGTFRDYGFEVLGGADGILLAETTRRIDYGSTYQFANNYVSSYVSNLVYFAAGSAYTSHATSYSSSMAAGKYYDEYHTGSRNKWTKVTDAGYKQAVYTVSTSSFFARVGATREYVQSLGYDFHAKICFEARDVDDGYHYVQVLADNDSTCDGDDGSGAVGTPSTSFYKESHELAKKGTLTDEQTALYFVPHRFIWIDREKERDNVSTLPFPGFSDFSRPENVLYDQKAGTAVASISHDSGAFVFGSVSVTNLNIRFDASGEDSDDWEFKNLFVRMAMADGGRPTVDGVGVSQGLNVQYNKATVTLSFNEIVKAPGVVLRTSWGDFAVQENEDSRSNVLSFSGYISAEADTALTIRGFSGTITDLVGNPMEDISSTIKSQLAENKVGAFAPPAVSNGVVQIASVSDLYNYSKMVDQNPRLSAVLLCDLDMSHLTPFLAFPAIGGVYGFAGTFDGKGHTIRGIKAISTGWGNKGRGLFNSITPAGVVKNVAIVDLEVESSGNLAFGGICGSNAGTVEGCWFSGAYSPGEGSSGDYGGIVGVNETRGVVRNCVSVENEKNQTCDVVGRNEGTMENDWFLYQNYLSSGRVCYILNGGVTNGTQVWYQTIGTDAAPRRSGGTVYKHGETYVNTITHAWGAQTYGWSEDFSNMTATAVCQVGGETYAETYPATSQVTKQPTCTEPGTTTWTANVPSNAYGFRQQTKDQEGVPAAVGYPTYLEAAGDAVLARYADWGRNYGYDLGSTHQTAFLLDVSPNQQFPSNAALFKVVAFRRSETNLYFELASDVAMLRQSSVQLGTCSVCNGYLTFNVSPGSLNSTGTVYAVGFPLVVDSQGHACVDIDLTTLSPIISATLFPAAALIRPALTIEMPQFVK